MFVAREGKYMKKHISLITLICLLLGVAAGLIFKESVESIAFIGTYYISLLKIMIGPVIFTSISYTIYKTRLNKDKLVLKSVVTFAIMYTVTFLITSLLVKLINPAKGFIVEEIEWTGTTTNFNIKDILINLIPKSFSDLFLNPKVFAIIVIAYLFGKLIRSEKVFDVINKIKEFLFKILEIIMYITPLAAFSLIANTTVKFGPILLGVGLKYILTAYFCSIICVILVMILPVKLIGKVKINDYIQKVSRIWAMTISTCSSAATLPYTVKTCKEDFGVKEEITDVVVPLGCTIHMCGGAVSFALLGFFCASMYGVEINFLTFIIMLISSLLINMAAPGIPNGGVVIGASYLELLGIPLGFIGFYSGIYKLLDMCYTTLNVTGDISANIVINELEKK